MFSSGQLWADDDDISCRVTITQAGIRWPCVSCLKIFIYLYLSRLNVKPFLSILSTTPLSLHCLYLPGLRTFLDLTASPAGMSPKVPATLACKYSLRVNRTAIAPYLVVNEKACDVVLAFDLRISSRKLATLQFRYVATEYSCRFTINY